MMTMMAILMMIAGSCHNVTGEHDDYDDGDADPDPYHSLVAQCQTLLAVVPHSRGAFPQNNHYMISFDTNITII